MQEHLVLIPGLLCTSELWLPQIAALGVRRPVTVADHTSEVTMAAQAQAILAASPDRFALAGLSMGGYLALEMLAQAPERITRVALLDTSARADVAEQSALRKKLVALAQDSGLAAVMEILLPKFIPSHRISDTALVASIMRMAENTGVEAFVRQQAAIISRADSRSRLARIDCPTLVIVGEEDVLTPPDLSREIAEGISGARLEVVPACGHISTLERPKIINALLHDWLA